jgi:hypothetical protein
MKMFFSVLLLTLAASCGNSGAGHSGGSDKQLEQIQQGPADQVDLLESMIDVNIDTTPSEILFRQSKISTAQGRKISCETKVQGGESYAYAIDGDKMHLTMNGETLTFDRLNGGTGLQGGWVWQGTDTNGEYIIRSLNFLGTNRLIMKTHCEN